MSRVGKAIVGAACLLGAWAGFIALVVCERAVTSWKAGRR